MGLIKKIHDADRQLSNIKVTTTLFEEGEEKIVLTKKARKIKNRIDVMLTKIGKSVKELNLKNYHKTLLVESQ